jgi:hypothetical protein
MQCYSPYLLSHVPTDGSGRTAYTSHPASLPPPVVYILIRSVGSTFPQTSVPHKAIQDASLAVAAACQRAGVIGHLAVDFVTHVDEERGGALRLWAVDLVLAPTPSLMAYQLFDFLTVGSFDPDMGTYSVELEPLGPEESQQEAAGQQGRQGTMPRGSSAGAVPASREGYVEGGHAGPRESETSLSLSARQPIPSVAGNLGAPDGASQAGVGTSNSSPPTDDRALVFGDDLLLNHDPGASPDMSPPQADAALMGERPATADLPSGLPSTRGSSSTATRPGTVGSLLGPQHQHHSRASASNQQDDQQPQQQQGAGASSRAVGQQISHSRWVSTRSTGCEKAVGICMYASLCADAQDSGVFILTPRVVLLDSPLHSQVRVHSG